MDDGAYELAMFPLSGVLVPGAVIPLHVFEARYRALMEHLIGASTAPATRGELGVVLIERGSEIGGDDTRSTTGTVANIAQARRFDDGRWAVVLVGQRRVEVTRWLADDPWPQAVVVDRPDEPSTLGSTQIAELVGETVAELRRTLAIASELGEAPAAATLEMSDEPVMASYQVTALGPFGPLDRHRLLACPGPVERLTVAKQLLREQRELFELRLGSDPDGPPTEPWM